MARVIITLSPPLFYILFISLLSHQTLCQAEHMFTFCNPIENFTQPSSYQSNRNILLSSLDESSSLGTYSNRTIGLSPDTVHGMFLCRGDMTLSSCSECVQTATTDIANECRLNKRAVIYYEECMVRYSDVSFLSELAVRPSIIVYFNGTVPNSNQFNQTLSDKFDQLILNISSSTRIPYFVQDKELVTSPEGSYELESMVQCSPDLGLSNCTLCLRFISLRVSTCCGLPSFAQVFTPKCLLMYNTTVLSSPTPTPSPLPPQSPPTPASPPPSSFPPESPSPPPLSETQQPPPPPPPPGFTPPQNFPSPSGSFSINGNVIFGSIVVTLTALVFALVDM